MAKPEKLFTFKKAQGYLASNGMELSTQQIRNLARTNDVVMAGVTEYTDPITDETTKVIAQSALDGYIVWKRDHPESMRGGRRSATEKRAYLTIGVDQLDRLNDVLLAAGFQAAAFPVSKPRKPRANAGAVSAPINTSNGETADVGDLELMEIDS